jgi:hypothetical protein
MLWQGRDPLGIDLTHIVFLGSVELHTGLNVLHIRLCSNYVQNLVFPNGLIHRMPLLAAITTATLKDWLETGDCTDTIEDRRGKALR